MKVDAFDFHLPPSLIAQRPAVPRDAARLLDVGDDFRDLSVRNLPELLQPGDVLVFNDTRVIPARLRGTRGAGRVEVTLHKASGPGRWLAFARPARRLRPGDEIAFAPELKAQVAEKHAGGEVELDFDMSEAALLKELDRHGEMPLPPYIRREAGSDVRDSEDYQTIFATRPGAVAAPTAALHFTPDLLEALDRRGVRRELVTLHVGAGTFLPVKVEDTADHRMHAERGIVTPETAAAINEARARGGRVVAVGTTSLRLLESAARADGMLEPFTGETDIFITPGYRFRIVDLLLTNFHLPRSTLFMLVSAFAGLERMRAAYGHAIREGYRFYSYGDCCLLHRVAE